MYMQVFSWSTDLSLFINRELNLWFNERTETRMTKKGHKVNYILFNEGKNHTYSLVWSTQSRAAEADVENEGVAHVLLVSMWHMSEKSSRSTLNTAVSSPVQWPQADRSVWPHRSLRRSPSTPAQRESGCCSSCTDRPSPGAQRCSPETCFSRSASSSGSSLTGSPCWPHTPVSLSSLRRSLHWRAAGRSL